MTSGPLSRSLSRSLSWPLAPGKGVGGRAAYLGPVATRCRITHRANTALTDITSRTLHKLTDDVTALRLLSTPVVVAETIIGGTSDYTEQFLGAVTRTAVFRNDVAGIGGSTIARVKWSGVSSVTESAAQLYVSDAIPFVGAKGSWIACEQHEHAAAGIPFYAAVGNNELNTVLGDQTSLDAADKTGTSWNDGSFGGSGFGAAAGYGLFPLGILGMTKKGTVLLIDNSIGEGIYDTVDASGDLGHMARAVGAAGLAYIDCSVSGDSHAKFIASSSMRQSLKQYVTGVHLAGPTNDNLGSEPTLEANIQTILGYFPGKKRSMASCTPETSGAWTLVNQTDQTISRDFETIGINPYIRAKPPNVDGVFDYTAVVATGTRGNRYWNADGTVRKWTQDGTHPVQYAYLQIVSAIQSAVAALFA